MINRAALEKIHSLHGDRRGRGREAAHRRRGRDGNGLGDGFFYRPTIFGDVDPGMRIAQEEIFGPTTALIRVADVDEAVRVSNGIEFGLSSSIFTRDVNTAFRAMRDLEAGITYINAGTIGAEVHLPFGGIEGHRATATARRARPRSTSSPSGSRSTSTTRASCRAPRSTPPNSSWRSRPLGDADRGWVERLVVERWGDSIVTGRGGVWHPAELPGFAAFEGERCVGLVTYELEGDACEIVTIDASKKGRGSEPHGPRGRREARQGACGFSS